MPLKSHSHSTIVFYLIKFLTLVRTLASSTLIVGTMSVKNEIVIESMMIQSRISLKI
jgi:hypothetical protein